MLTPEEQLLQQASEYRDRQEQNKALLDASDQMLLRIAGYRLDQA